MYIATPEQPASYLFITRTSHLNHTRPQNAPHATLKFRVLLLNARTQHSFDQTDDGVDAETSLSLSLHVYLSSPPLYFFLTLTIGQWTQSSTVPHELVLSRSRTGCPRFWPFSALPHFLHLRGFFAAFVASRRGMSNRFPSGPKAPASYVGPSRSTAASSFLAFFCFLFFRCILDSSLVAFSAFRTHSSAADMAASICDPGTYPSRSNNLFTKVWPSLNIPTAMAAAKKTTDGLLNFVFGAIAQIVECRASLLFCVNPLDQRLRRDSDNSFSKTGLTTSATAGGRGG